MDLQSSVLKKVWRIICSVPVAISLVVWVIAGFPDRVAANQASVVINGYSIGFGPAMASNGTVVYFTSYDGSSEFPLHDEVGGYYLFSSECAIRVHSSNTCYSDYVAANNQGIYEYGYGTMTLNDSDRDGDGTLDALEIDRAGNFSFSGTAYSHWNYWGYNVTSRISGNVRRSADSQSGTYSGTFSNNFDSASVSGEIFISGATGVIDYEVGSNFVSWDLRQRTISGDTARFRGTTTFERLSADAIRIPSFTLQDDYSSRQFRTRTVTLIRDGDAFRGDGQLIDGEPETSWADYVDFRVTIQDSNDANSDGVPDLTYVPEPAPALQGIAAIAVVTCLRTRRRAS